MTIGKSAARIDLTELDTERVPAADILAQLLARTSRDVSIDPAAFAEGALERRVRSLHSHSLLYRRDTGIDGLYLGFPFLLMREARGNTRTTDSAHSSVAGADYSRDRQPRTRDIGIRKGPSRRPRSGPGHPQSRIRRTDGL